MLIYFITILILAVYTVMVNYIYYYVNSILRHVLQNNYHEKSAAPNRE